MPPGPKPLAPDADERRCAIPGCDQSPCFQALLERPGRPACDCDAQTANACAAHLVDVIHELAQWAHHHCPHPADVTVYATGPTPGPGTEPRGFAFTTIHVPG